MRDEGGHSFCANKYWYIHVEPRLKEFVGQHAAGADEALRSPQARALAHGALYKLLPTCRNCACIAW